MRTLNKPKNDVEEIIQELMQEFNLGKVQTEAIITSPYKFIFKKMREEKFYNFNLQGIGKIFVSPGRREWLKKNYPKLQAERKARQQKKLEYFNKRRELKKLWDEYENSKQTEGNSEWVDQSSS